MKSHRLLVSLMAAGALLALPLTSQALVVGSVVGGGYGPNCGGAAASQEIIWPPKHQMVAESILGVTDPYSLPITIKITGIEQDEPVEGAGSGHTQPDGSGVGTSTAYVRAERDGPGTGRLYFISFTATVPTGQQCTATVEAYVPHDQGQGFVPIDTGKRYNSTQLVYY